MLNVTSGLASSCVIELYKRVLYQLLKIGLGDRMSFVVVRSIICLPVLVRREDKPHIVMGGFHDELLTCS
jgi:hypothetical protein